MGRMDSKKMIYSMASLFAVIAGFSFLAAKVAIKEAEPLDGLAFRFLIAFVFALFLLAVKTVTVDFKGKPIGRLLLSAGFYVIGFFGFQFIGLKYATSIEGGIIFAMIPILTMIIAEIFLKEKPNLWQRFFVVLSICGVLTLFIQGNDGFGVLSGKGMLLLGISSFFMAGNNVIMRWLRKDFTAMEISISACFLGCVFYNIVFILSFGVAGSIQRYGMLLQNSNFMISAIYLGIGCTMVTSLLNAYIMSKLEAIKGSIFGNIGTLISVVAGALLMDEPLHWYHLLCMILIISGVLGTVRFAGNPMETLPSKKIHTK